MFTVFSKMTKYSRHLNCFAFLIIYNHVISEILHSLSIKTWRSLCPPTLARFV